MSYARVSLGGMPPTAYTASVGRAVLADKGALATPEAKLAASVFEGAMSGNAGAAEAAIKSAGATMAAAGAAAACAATGAGTAVAPLCAMAGSLIFGKLSSFLGGGGGKPCLDTEEEIAQAQMAPYLGGGPANTKLFCDGDAACEAKIQTAAYDYADRLAYCSVSYNWPLTPTMMAEAKKLGIPPWPVRAFQRNGALDTTGNRAAVQSDERLRSRLVYDWLDPRWAAYAKQKFLGETTAAIAERKVKAWSKAALDAKKLADSEYDALVKACAPLGGLPRVRVSGSITPCERKAANTATVIASRAYMYSVIDGAPAIQSSETQALRQQFRDEVDQDRTNAGTAATAALLLARDEQRTRDDRANDIKAAQVGTQRNSLLGIGLLAAAALGGVYLVSQHTKGARR